MNRRDLCKKSVAFFLATGVLSALRAAPAAGHTGKSKGLTTHPEKARLTLWRQHFPESGETNLCLIETIDRGDGTYGARAIGDKGDFWPWREREDNRIVRLFGVPVTLGREFHPKVGVAS